MRKAHWGGVAALIGALGLLLAGSGSVHSQRLGQTTVRPATLKGKIVAATKLSEEDVGKVLDALGPAVRDLLGAGQQVDLPNMGTFRVVRIPEHRDMVNGRPATIAAANYVEFVSSARFAESANLPGVKPAETVPPFEYNPLPDQIKGLKTGSSRIPGTRNP